MSLPTASRPTPDAHGQLPPSTWSAFTLSPWRKRTPRAAWHACQGFGKFPRIARFVACRVGAADDRHPRAGQGRFDGKAFGRRLRYPLAAEFAHQRRLRHGMLEFAEVSVEMQDAAFQLVVFERQFAPQRLQGGAAGSPSRTMAPTLARARAAVHSRRKRRPQAPLRRHRRAAARAAARPRAPATSGRSTAPADWPKVRHG
jgi:hypothetical protein